MVPHPFKAVNLAFAINVAIYGAMLWNSLHENHLYPLNILVLIAVMVYNLKKKKHKYRAMENKNGIEIARTFIC